MSRKDLTGAEPTVGLTQGLSGGEGGEGTANTGKGASC